MRKHVISLIQNLVSASVTNGLFVARIFASCLFYFYTLVASDVLFFVADRTLVHMVTRMVDIWLPCVAILVASGNVFGLGHVVGVCTIFAIVGVIAVYKALFVGVGGLFKLARNTLELGTARIGAKYLVMLMIFLVNLYSTAKIVIKFVHFVVAE